MLCRDMLSEVYRRELAAPEGLGRGRFDKSSCNCLFSALASLICCGCCCCAASVTCSPPKDVELAAAVEPPDGEEADGACSDAVGWRFKGNSSSASACVHCLLRLRWPVRHGSLWEVSCIHRQANEGSWCINTQVHQWQTLAGECATADRHYQATWTLPQAGLGVCTEQCNMWSRQRGLTCLACLSQPARAALKAPSSLLFALRTSSSADLACDSC